MHLYPGTAGSYPEDIHLPDDGDPDAAAAYDVAFAQLADRTATLKTGGIGLDFTDCIFHGTTIFADGSISATVGTVSIAAATSMLIGTPTLQVNATQLDGNFQTIDIDASGGDINISSTAGMYLDGAPFRVNGGQFEINGFNIKIGNNPFEMVIIGAGGVDFADAAVTFSGAVTFDATSTINVAGFQTVNRQALGTLLHADTDADLVAGTLTLDGSSVYEHVFSNSATVIRGLTLSHAGAVRGQRIRLNAQLATTVSPNYYRLVYGAKEWHFSNQTGFTVILEFVSDGSQWVVDEWAEGGSARRNGTP